MIFEKYFRKFKQKICYFQKIPRMSTDQRNESGSGAKLKVQMKKSKTNTQFSLNRETTKQLLSNSNINWAHTSNSLPGMGNTETSFQGHEGQDSIKEDAVFISRMSKFNNPFRSFRILIYLILIFQLIHRMTKNWTEFLQRLIKF